ncbi:MAG: hypothetical protein II581_08595, partial [Oscillospiraceae bacterium]|nr:hypothetical protein [Oscillospiraceae bacterium]
MGFAVFLRLLLAPAAAARLLDGAKQALSSRAIAEAVNLIDGFRHRFCIILSFFNDSPEGLKCHEDWLDVIRKQVKSAGNFNGEFLI